MVFSSNVFLFLFLPIFLGLYYLSGQRYRNLLLLIASYVFYAWWRVDFLALFIGVTVWNYWIGLQIGAAGVRTKPAQRWLLLGVVVDLGILGYFKYANFGVDSINAMMTSVGLEPFILTHVLLPIGISFYVFESISYIIDVYRGDTPATRNLIDFAAFVAIFPHLIAGPVLRFRDLADQFNNRTHTLDKFSEGCTRFMQGFIKKVFIADTLAVVADHCFALENPTTGDAWLGALAYTAQLYFDFSGYSDMAIGLGLMMGFRFMENFKQPYISQSITEFWRRWHISLSTWLRDYLYITLGGNRGSKFATYRNLFLTMLLGGLWHGANITYVIWGAWHGIWLAIEKAIGLNTAPRTFNVMRWALTFLIVVTGWVIFRSENLHVAGRMYSAMFGFGDWKLSELNQASLTGLQVATMVVAYATLAFFGLRDFYANRPAEKAASKSNPDLGVQADGPATAQPGMIKAVPGDKPGSIHEPGYIVGTEAQVQPAYWVADWPRYAMRALILLLFIASILKLSAQSFSPFLYFQF
ncbi:MBOAT family O-acyltransferase [Pseudomonas quasicaspiana]|uniref:MBOAT family O-acyltransferase n=1 Tax=Pseudomonas quasicaspiana TaxID=2829821 RepID=UPI000F063FC8|nr:MBOAT family protein [Pseudomonas quasicaspiana]MCD5970355.1 MBOAT family protein [Pseudomonas quasicaspiana]MCD5980367.1 MBOAT family protein [Pseudomonas quasicaspiana]